MTPQAVFLDRDGTLIEWVHYLSDPELVALTDGVAEALRRLKAAGCLLFLHTNQSGVGRGYFGVDAVEAVNVRMLELLGLGPAVFDAVCVAPETPEEAGADSYRKPRPRFVEEMVARHSLDRDRCYFVGDRESDARTGVNARIHSVGIWREGDPVGRREAFEDLGAWVFPSVAAFAEAVLG